MAAVVPARAQVHNTAAPLPTSKAAFLAGLPSQADVRPDSAAQNLRLIVGHSTFLKTTNRLRRVYVSDPQVVRSFTASPNEVVITAKAPGVGSVALWDAMGSSLLYTVSVDLDVDALRRSIKLALPAEDVRIQAQEGRIYLSGSVASDDAYKQAASLASIYSKDVVNSLIVTYVHPKQVQLKVRIAEIDRTKLAQFGFNFFSTGSKMSSVSTQQFSSVGLTQGTGGGAEIGLSSPLNLFLYDAKLNVGVTIADLEAHNVLQILAEPTITTINGHEASFLSGGEFPYPVIQGGGSTFASVTIMFRPYGVKLTFTPNVNADGTILLKVAPEVSALDYSNTVTISGYTLPAISTRRAETEVELKNGESFSISGLLDHRTTVLLSQVPGIGNIPVLGELFKSKNNSHSVVELVVIVTATVVDPLHSNPNPVTPKMAIPNLSADEFDHPTPPNSKTKP
jgi:pilus assembly protein CpaC